MATNYMFTAEQVQVMCNEAVGLVINTMYNDGLTEWTDEMVAGDYAVILHEKGAFGRLFDRLFNHPKSALALRVVSLSPLKGGKE